MNPLIWNFSRENNFKLLRRRLGVENFDFFVRDSSTFTENIFETGLQDGYFLNPQHD